MAAKRARCAADFEGAASKRLKQGGIEEFGSGTVSFCVSSPVLQMPFWAENGHGVDHGTAAGASSSDSIHVQAASLQQWAAQCSVSFKHSGCPDDDETEDTATSSCSSASHQGSQDRTTASQEGDEGDSHPQVPNAQKQQQQEPTALSASAFSFGKRACVMPDLSGFEQWEVIATLLALGQS